MKFDEFKTEFARLLQEKSKLGFKSTCGSCGQKVVISFKERELAFLITTFIIGNNMCGRTKEQLIEELARANEISEIVPSRSYAEEELHGQVSRILSGLTNVCVDFEEFWRLTSKLNSRFTTNSLANVTVSIQDIRRLGS